MPRRSTGQTVRVVKDDWTNKSQNVSKCNFGNLGAGGVWGFEKSLEDSIIHGHNNCDTSIMSVLVMKGRLTS